MAWSLFEPSQYDKQDGNRPAFCFLLQVEINGSRKYLLLKLYELRHYSKKKRYKIIPHAPNDVLLSKSFILLSKVFVFTKFVFSIFPALLCPVEASMWCERDILVLIWTPLMLS